MVCKISRINKSNVFHLQLNWFAAANYCHDLGYVLAKIRSDKDKQNFHRLITKEGKY